MVKDLNILKHTNLTVKMVYSNGKFLDNEISESLMDFADALDSKENPKIEESCRNISSFGECFQKEFNSTFTHLYKDDPEKLRISLEAHDWLENYIFSYDSIFSLNDLSKTSVYKDCEGDLLLNWDGNGYKTILELMLKGASDSSQQFPLSTNLLLNKEVTKVIWNNNTNKNLVRCSDNTEYEADHVIFTASLGVLKANHEKIFEPDLPNEKAKAIENVGFGAIMKIVLHFNTTWWNADEDYVFLWSPKDKDNILSEFDKGPMRNGRSWLTTSAIFFTAENNPKVLIGFFTGEMVQDLEKESDDVLRDGCMYIFKKFLGKKFPVVEADKIIKSTWYNNPHFRGTYSYESVKGIGSRPNEMLATPLIRANGDPSIQFAGEATHPYYYSTVHGAIETGYREADRLINLYAKK